MKALPPQTPEGITRDILREDQPTPLTLDLSQKRPGMHALLGLVNSLQRVPNKKPESGGGCPFHALTQLVSGVRTSSQEILSQAARAIFSQLSESLNTESPHLLVGPEMPRTLPQRLVSYNDTFNRVVVRVPLGANFGATLSAKTRDQRAAAFVMLLNSHAGYALGTGIIHTTQTPRCVQLTK